MIQKTTERDYLTIAEYIKLAKQTIQAFCSNYNCLFHDADAIDYIAHKIMYGDWKWNHEKGCSRKTYRCHRAMWAIREYGCKIKPRKKQYVSTEEVDELLVSSTLEEWKRDKIIMDLNIDLDSIASLTEKEKFCIRKIYLEHCKVAELAEQCGISKPVIYIAINNGIEKIKQFFGV